MAIQEIKIESIFRGWSPTQYVGGKDTFNSSLSIDPDLAIGSDVKTSGMLIPTIYEEFSSSAVDGYPKWLITNNKDTKLYTYISTGKFFSYTSGLSSASQVLVGTPTSGAGNGAAYYNNYIYLATPTNISRYGPLDNSPALTNTVWTGATLGSQTALTNTTYPSLRGTPIPNHPMHVHGDNFLYFGDYINGQGLIHKIKTSKTTNEGDTNNGSAYNALDLPFGFAPTDIESWGTDLVICAIQTTDTVINQGKSALFFWDTLGDSFYRMVYLPDPLATALLNINGVLHVWTGNTVNGTRLSKYIGGDSIQEIVYQEEGVPPFAGAVDALGGRIVWGNYTTYPAARAGVFAYGSKRPDIPKGVHHIAASTISGGTTPTVTAIKYVQQSSSIEPKLVIGGGDGTDYTLDKSSTSMTYVSVFRSNMFNVGAKFMVKEIRIPMGATISGGTSIVAKVYLDDGSSSVTLPTINSTNYPSARKVKFKDPDLKSAIGENNFFLELTWSGTVILPVTLPIVIKIDIFEDEKA